MVSCRQVIKKSGPILLQKNIIYEFRIKNTFDSLPTGNPKTIFQHVPLYVESVDEAAASEKQKSLILEHRMDLLDQYSKANVDHVFSGHVHFNSVPPPYKVRVNKIMLKKILMSFVERYAYFHPVFH